MSRNNVFQYTVGATPDKNLVYTNHVYLADDASNAALLTKRSGQTDTYVLVNNSIVYVARPHKGVNPGEIGLSSIQREACQVMQGALTSIAYWEQPRDGRADLVTLSLNLDLVGIKRTTVAAVELAPMLIKYFAGQVFTKGQIFCCEYNGAALKFRVEYGEAGVPVNEQNKKLQHAQETDDASDDEGAVTQQVDRGVLHKGTQIELTAAANKSLTFIPEARKPQMLNPKFKFSEMGIGGLDAEFGMIFRRAFMSRMYPEQSRKLGVPPVKGMLLYGPPGTGKTLIARQIGKLLATKEPKVVNGPEILNKFVGASEENIRNLFKEAEEDQKANGDNAELHIIILDEIDAICKARGRGGDSTGVHDTIVNQFLSKIDGVEALNNILVIGMTNRKELIDPALLRPGRLEVHIEIGLPDEKGRVQIFNIQLAKMKENGMLAPDVVVEDLARETRNFSGAEIGGVAKSAASFALFETHDMKHGTKAVDMSNKRILVARHHFERAISEVTPAFGVDEDEFKLFLRAPLINYGPEYERLMKTCETLVNQVRTDKETPLLSLLLEGPTGAGKTAIAAKLAVESKFPFAKVITPEQFVGYSESKKINDIAKIFEDAYKSPLSVIVLDSIERLIEYTPVGPRFSQGVLQTLLVLVKRLPPHPNRRLLVLGTSSHAALLESLEITQAFNVAKRVPALTNARQVEAVLATKAFPTANGPAGLREIASQCFLPIPVKELLRVQAMARQELTTQGVVTPARFQECLVECGFDSGAAISMHSTIAGKSDLKYYTSGASAAAGKGKKNAGDSDDDDY